MTLLFLPPREISKTGCLLLTDSCSVILSHSAINHIRNPHFSGESDKIIWFCGMSEVTIADLHDLKMTEFKNFLPSLGPGKDPVALRSILKDNGETLVVSFMVENTFGVAFQHKSIKEPHVYLLPEVAPGCKSLFTSQNTACDGQRIRRVQSCVLCWNERF